MDFHTVTDLTKDYISHHPLHLHSCLHWSRTHLQTITQSPSPNHTHTHSLYKPWTFSHTLPSIVSQSTYKALPWFPSLFLPLFPVCLVSRLPSLDLPCLTLPVFLDILSALPFGLWLPRCGLLLVALDYLSASPSGYCTPIADPRSPLDYSLPCLYYTCLLLSDPACIDHVF